MKPRQQVSRTAVELIKTFEGYREKAAQLPDGRWTIGYGHALTAREGAQVSRADAEALLLYDLIGVAHAVNEAVFTPLSQNQFDALACFAFNIGVDNFRGSAVLKRVNEGSLLQAAYAMEMWRRADFEGERIVIDALVRRRAAEKALFLTPPAGWTPAPTPVLPPKIDTDVEAFAPRQKPAEVHGTLEGPLALLERDDAGHVAGSTATERAAAVVTARLETLLPEAEPATPPRVSVSRADRALTPDAAPPPRVEAWAAPTLNAPMTPPPVEAAAEAADEAASEGRGADDLPPFDADQAAAVDRRPRPSKPEPAFRGGWLMLLALVGLAIFAGGIFQGLNGTVGPAGGLAVPALIGWALAVAGALCFGSAAYGLLSNLGDDEA